MTRKEIKNKTKRVNLRKFRIRKKINGTADRPRLSLFCSNLNIAAQIIDDTNQKTIASCSSIKMDKKNTNKTQLSYDLGAQMGDILIAKKINTVVFDRNGKLFHGIVKSFADGVKSKGIKI